MRIYKKGKQVNHEYKKHRNSNYINDKHLTGILRKNVNKAYNSIAQKLKKTAVNLYDRSFESLLFDMYLPRENKQGDITICAWCCVNDYEFYLDKNYIIRKNPSYKNNDYTYTIHYGFYEYWRERRFIKNLQEEIAFYDKYTNKSFDRYYPIDYKWAKDYVSILKKRLERVLRIKNKNKKKVSLSDKNYTDSRIIPKQRIIHNKPLKTSVTNYWEVGKVSKVPRIRINIFNI